MNGQRLLCTIDKILLTKNAFHSESATYGRSADSISFSYIPVASQYISLLKCHMSVLSLLCTWVLLCWAMCSCRCLIPPLVIWSLV